jgi:cobaltochelatase CobT
VKKDIMVIRESIGRVVSMLTQQSIQVTMRGSRAYVKYHPKTGAIVEVNIPYIPDDASEEFIAAIQGFLDHEVGHVLYSDFQALKEATAAGKRVANLANIIEDVFIERKMTENFRGSGTNLESVRKFYLEKIARVKIEAALAVGDVEEARGYATVAAFRGWGGQTSAMDFIREPKIAELVKSVADKLGPDLMNAIGKCKNSMECLDLAKKFKVKLEEPKPKAPPMPPPEDYEASEKDSYDEDKSESEDEGSTTVESDDSGKTGAERSTPVEESTESGESEGPDVGDKEASEDEKKDTEESVSRDSSVDKPEDEEKAEDIGVGTSGEASEDAEDDSGKREGAPGGDAESSEDGDSPAAESPDFDPEDEFEPDPLADMFDKDRDFDKDIGEGLSKEAKGEIGGSKYSVFSTEWDKIELAPLASSPKSVQKLEDGIRDKVGVMQKQLERGIAAQAKKAWNPGQRKGRISPGALFKTAAGDDRVFRQRFETKAKNTAVSLVIDCSGSMSGSRIKLAGTAAFALASVLERLRLQYEVIGFTTNESSEMVKLMQEDARFYDTRVSGMKWGRVEPIYMPVFKPFGGKLDTAARSRIAHLTEGPSWISQNIDGESVQIAARRLIKQTAERHVMIVMSDGDPACSMGRGQEEHLKRTVKSIEAQGVEVIGIGIETRSVKSYYRKSVVLSELSALPTQVMAELTKLLLAK